MLLLFHLHRRLPILSELCKGLLVNFWSNLDFCACRFNCLLHHFELLLLCLVELSHVLALVLFDEWKHALHCIKLALELHIVRLFDRPDNGGTKGHELLFLHDFFVDDVALVITLLFKACAPAPTSTSHSSAVSLSAARKCSVLSALPQIR